MRCPVWHGPTVEELYLDNIRRAGIDGMTFTNVLTLYGRSKSLTEDVTTSERCRATIDGVRIPCQRIDVRMNGHVTFDGCASAGKAWLPKTAPSAPRAYLRLSSDIF